MEEGDTKRLQNQSFLQWDAGCSASCCE